LFLPNFQIIRLQQKVLTMIPHPSKSLQDPRGSAVSPPARRGFLRRRAGKNSGKAAFSLIEVALALGVVAVAFVPVAGLLPLGLQSYHQANDNSMQAEIFQRIVNELQQTDFGSLTSSSNPPPYRYFDYQGNEVTASEQYIYQVNTRISSTTNLPEGAQPAVNNPNLAIATIQVADNPGHAVMTQQSATGNMPYLWSTTTPSITTFFTDIARNK